MDGLWSSPDLPALLRLAARNREALALSGGWFRVPAQLAPDDRPSGAPQHAVREPAQHRRPLRPRQRLLPAVPRRDDDLLERGLRVAPTSRWPMPSGTSTGGSRPTPELRAGQHVLEIGTGWGGFALYAAGELGCRVTTITISQEQYELARERVRDGRARPPRRRPAPRLPRHRGHVRRDRLDRDARGGRRRVPRDVLRDVRSRAAPGRPASLQVITFPDAAYERQLRGANWIQTYIFPGGLCPSLAVIERATRDTALLITGVTDIAADYVRTLRRVADARSSDRLDDVRALGLRRAVHPDVGVLPRPERGGLRDRPQPGPADRAWRRRAASIATRVPNVRPPVVRSPREMPASDPTHILTRILTYHVVGV